MIADNFWDFVDKSGECWLWQRGKNLSGYGQMSFNGRNQLAHRIAWQKTYSPIPEGLCVLHTCDTPACVRPDHLWLGTHADNMADLAAKGRAVSGAITKPWTIIRGEQRPLSKLTEEVVIEARKLHATGNWSYRRLARKYEVSYPTIRWAIRGETWKHIPKE